MFLLLPMQENGSLIVSVDAIFGLCRKKTASKSVRGPLSGTTVFEAQEVVNSFVSPQNNLRSVKSQVC